MRFRYLALLTATSLAGFAIGCSDDAANTDSADTSTGTVREFGAPTPGDTGDQEEEQNQGRPAGGGFGGGGGGRGGEGGGGGFDPAAIFERRDANGDGQLSGDEISGRMQERVSALDTDGDGSVSRAEFDAGMQNFAGGGGGGGGRPGGFGGGGGPGGGGPGGGFGGRGFGGRSTEDNRPDRPARPEFDDGITDEPSQD